MIRVRFFPMPMNLTEGAHRPGQKNINGLLELPKDAQAK
jgi:hypothetical protein